MPGYVPAQGDLVVLSFDPQTVREQMGRRPGIVVSVDAFNRITRLAICCPITNTKRETPFHVPVPEDCGLTGYVMSEQLKAIDYHARGMRKIGDATQKFLDEVLSVIDACIFPGPDPGSRGDH
ncbi:MAG: type II toxin-antitoxin system PemK/MazF family toxin [Puniceicoccaceae bacterium]